MPLSQRSFTISELAREFDLTTRAIRFYEDKGLLTPARAGTGGLQRVYSSRDRARLTLTLRAKRLGLSLDAYPNLKQIAARCDGLPEFANARPEAQPDFPG